MTERSYRLLIGIWLVPALVLEWPEAIYILMGVLLFVGFINASSPFCTR